MADKEILIELLKQNEIEFSYYLNKAADAAISGDAWERMMNRIEFTAEYLVSKGVTVQKWIPASEPPKEDGTYIVKTARGTVTTAIFYAFKSFPATRYLPATHRQAAWQSNRKVTHWMHLPPKEGE